MTAQITSIVAATLATAYLGCAMVDEPYVEALDDDDLAIFSAPGAPLIVGSTSSYGWTDSPELARPSAVSEGDYLLAAFQVRGARSLIGAPTGWTLLNGYPVVTSGGSYGNTKQYVYAKSAGASEPASWRWTQDGTQHVWGALIAVRGHDAGTPIHARATAQAVSATSITGPSLTTTAANTLLVGFFAARNVTSSPVGRFTAPTGMTVLQNRNDNYGGILLASTTVVQPGSTGISVASYSRSSDLSASMIAIAPAPLSSTGLAISTPLSVNPTALGGAGVVTGRVTYQNASSNPVRYQAIVVTARPPGGTHAGGPFYDLSPALPAGTLAAGASVTLTASLSLSSSAPKGTWEVYSTYKDEDGVWHDGPSVALTVGSDSIGPRPVDLTPTGTVRYVTPGQSWSAAVNASSSGDTVVVRAGNHARQTINRSLASGNINVFAEVGATVTVAGLNLTGAAGLTFRGFTITGNVYLSGSRRMAIQGNRIYTTYASRARGIDVRDNCSDILIADNRYAGNAAGAPGYYFLHINAVSDSTRPTNITIAHNDSGPVHVDHIFISRGRFITIEANSIHGIVDSPEHSDGVQSVGGQDLYIRRNHFWDTTSNRDAAVDRHDQAIMLNSDPPTSRYTRNVEISNNLISNWVGTGVAVAGAPNTRVFNNTIYDVGANGTGTAASFDADSGNTVSVSLYNNILSSLYINRATIDRNDHNFVANGSGPAGSSRLTGNPGFVDRSSYRLTATSQNRNSASTTGAPTTDLFGVQRNSPSDRGAVAY
jgi:hypothetical protein